MLSVHYIILWELYICGPIGLAGLLVTIVIDFILSGIGIKLVAFLLISAELNSCYMVTLSMIIFYANIMATN